MKISFNWVEEVLGTKLDLSPKEVSEKLYSLGFEVSSLSPYSKCSGVVAAKILEIEKHPNADKLRLAKVTDGKMTRTVVCGAPNIQVGQVVLWAQVGAVLAGGETIKETSIRGVTSPGMICSAKELGVGDNHSGIWVLDEKTPLGTPVQKITALEDTVLDIEVTPNRPDCLSITGIAREIAALANLKAPQPQYQFQDRASLPFFPVEIEDKGGCFQYIAKKIAGTAVGSSTPKIQTRLIRSGIRPINNIVDITNYVLLETGQPLHAFDADKLEGGKISVRRALEWEKILALDGNTYPLDTDVLVIADAKKPVAIAGIMGGEETAVTEETKNILLESAIFSRGLVRHAKKKLSLSSESSYRFERGVSRWSVLAGSDEAESLIVHSAGGKIVSLSNVVSDPASERIPTVTVRHSQVESVLGEKIPATETVQIFQKLGIRLVSSNDQQLVVQSPDWRVDLGLEIDFIEEIARIRGYGKVPSAGTTIHLPSSSGSTQSFYARNKVRTLLQAMGFDESIHYGLVSTKEAAPFFPSDALVELANPLSEDQSVLRPALAVDLARSLKSNLSYQKKDVRLFEIGNVFQKQGGESLERLRVGGAACGKSLAETWESKKPAPIGFYWVKGAVENLLSRSQVDYRLVRLKDAVPRSHFLFPNHKIFFHPGYAFAVEVSGTVSGFAGLVHPAAARKLEVPETAVFFELDMDPFDRPKLSKAYQSISFYPTIERDCSIWVKKEVLWQEIVSEVESVLGAVLKRCRLFDVYEDLAQSGVRSLSFTLTFQRSDKTLDDETANDLRDKAVKALHKKFAAELRKK